MDQFERTVRYLFILMFFLIAVAYWSGTKNLLTAAGGEVVAVGNTYTGRNQAGTFAAYPKGA